MSISKVGGKWQDNDIIIIIEVRTKLSNHVGLLTDGCNGCTYAYNYMTRLQIKYQNSIQEMLNETQSQ